MTDKTIDARLTAKVASMNREQTIARMNEIAASPDHDSDEMLLEFAKLLIGPEATITIEEE